MVIKALLTSYQCCILIIMTNTETYTKIFLDIIIIVGLLILQYNHISEQQCILYNVEF